MGIFKQYNYELNKPYATGDVPFSLVRKVISAQVTKEPYYGFAFSPLVGAAGTKEGQSSVIAFNATPQMVKDSAAKVTIPMRRAVPQGTLPTYGDTMHVDFDSNFEDNLSTGINLGETEVYAGRIRYSETLKGKESERMIEYLAIFQQMTEQLTETVEQNLEEEVIFALHVGYSRNVTTYTGRGGANDKSHFQITPETFMRTAVKAGPYDITGGLTHPNETVVRLQTHMGSADKSLENLLDALTSATSASDGPSLDLMDSLHEYARSRKMKKVSTPWGMKFLWFIPPRVATALRQSDDWRTSHQNADVRGEGNALWSHALGTYGDILPIESDYILPATGELNTDGVDGDGNPDTQKGWGSTGNSDVWPTYLVGAGALGMALPKSVSTKYEEYDGGNVRIIIADKVHGLRRADFFDDAETMPAPRGAGPFEAQPGQSPVVWNWSSAVIWLYQAPTAGL